jgi:3-hydroxyisobutyrate dehydrogenase-like beta-hydroxyacid dehydrogenase
MMRVAFCGLGNMGRAMAANLAAAGHEVRAWNRTKGKAPEGTRESQTVREAAAEAEVAITMLADDAAVEGVASELAAALPQGAIHCGMSTVSLRLSRKLSRDHGERGQRYVAAPVYGRPEAAAAKKLFIVTGGERAALAGCKPLFDAMGQGIVEMGEAPEHAALLKICGNFVIASMIEMFGEAFTLAEKAGLDPQKLSGALSRILFADAPIPAGYAARVTATQFEPAAFAMPLGLKVVSLALEASAELRAPLPLASLLRDHFLASLAKGREKWDWGGMAAVIRESAGLPPRRG